GHPPRGPPPGPGPPGRAGRPPGAPWPTSSSASCPAPPSRSSPAATAASTYRRAVLRATPACSAPLRSPIPDSHARSTSRISVTATSRNAIPNPQVDRLGRSRTGSDQTSQADTPGGPITGNRVVPCSWQKTPQGGPISVAGDNTCAAAQRSGGDETGP